MTSKEREDEREKDELAAMLSTVICALELWAFGLLIAAHLVGVV